MDHASAYEELEPSSTAIDAPFALVDLDAMWSNAAEMLARAARQADPAWPASRCAAARCSSAILERDPASAG